MERLTFSVLWEMTPNADIISSTFTKAVIRSSAALTYAEAQSRIDDERLTDEVSVSLRHMNRLAKVHPLSFGGTWRGVAGPVYPLQCVV